MTFIRIQILHSIKEIMTTSEKTVLTVNATVNAPVELVWALWNDPRHITKWNQASPDWHTPTASSDLRPGGKFTSRMEARDGSMGFDFWGTYEVVKPLKTLAYTMGDGRKTIVSFNADGYQTHIAESFEAESQNPLELQQYGWQAILDSFKKYTEEAMAQSLHFETSIAAPAAVVFKTMLEAETYKAWTAAFNPTSRYEGSWKKGTEMRFLGTDEKGAVGGMISRIEENVENEFISIVHLGMILNGESLLDGPEVESWKGSREMYRFTESEGTTTLSITLEGMQIMMEYFNDAWPRALQLVKKLSEK